MKLYTSCLLVATAIWRFGCNASTKEDSPALQENITCDECKELIRLAECNCSDSTRYIYTAVEMREFVYQFSYDCHTKKSRVQIFCFSDPFNIRAGVYECCDTDAVGLSELLAKMKKL